MFSVARFIDRVWKGDPDPAFPLLFYENPHPIFFFYHFPIFGEIPDPVNTIPDPVLTFITTYLASKKQTPGKQITVISKSNETVRKRSVFN